MVFTPPNSERETLEIHTGPAIVSASAISTLQIAATTVSNPEIIRSLDETACTQFKAHASLEEIGEGDFCRGLFLYGCGSIGV